MTLFCNLLCRFTWDFFLVAEFNKQGEKQEGLGNYNVRSWLISILIQSFEFLPYTLIRLNISSSSVTGIPAFVIAGLFILFSILVEYTATIWLSCHYQIPLSNTATVFGGLGNVPLLSSFWYRWIHFTFLSVIQSANFTLKNFLNWIARVSSDVIVIS